MNEGFDFEDVARNEPEMILSSYSQAKNRENLLSYSTSAMKFKEDSKH